jgi:osmotically-inducible protein OsmY
MTRTDEETQRDILDELKYDPTFQGDDIAVAVRDGVVTLAGYAKSYMDKWQAERVVSRVKGVRGVANDIEVKLTSASERPDPEIARAAIDALRWNVSVPADRIRVKVEKGWVTLEGDVDWFFQKEAAERTVRSLTGVRGVTNLIAVQARPAPQDVKQKIKDALKRGAEIDADHITVEVEGSKAILKGTVRSYAEWRDAERAALKAPGITQVENKLVVDPNAYVPV